MNIAVIYGGESVEHEVSILTAVQLIENIAKDNMIIPIYITKHGKMYETINYKKLETYKSENNLKEVCFIPNSIYLYKKNIVGSYKKYKQIEIKTGKKVEVMVYGDGAFKDPQGKIS